MFEITTIDDTLVGKASTKKEAFELMLNHAKSLAAGNIAILPHDCYTNAVKSGMHQDRVPYLVQDWDNKDQWDFSWFKGDECISECFWIDEKD